MSTNAGAGTTGRVFVHGSGGIGAGESYPTQVEAAAAARAEVGECRTVDLQDAAPPPKVTRQEELLYSTDLAPIVRLAGDALTDVRRALTLLSQMSNDYAVQCGVELPAGPTDISGLPPMLSAWKQAFVAIAPACEALEDGFRRLAEVGHGAAKEERSRPNLSTLSLER